MDLDENKNFPLFLTPCKRGPLDAWSDPALALCTVLLRVYEELLVTTWNYTNRNVEIASI